MRRSARAAGALALALCALTPAGAASPGPGVAHEYPGADWERATPEALGFDPGALDAAVQRAGEAGSSCFLVTRRGRLAGEWYWNGTDPSRGQEVWSATKAVTSTLVGLARDEGRLDLDDRVSDYVKGWEGTDSGEVTVRNLLSNDSGRHWDYVSDYPALLEAEDGDAHAVGLGQDAEPGTTWVYNNAAVQALDVVLGDALGQDVAAFARDRLFEPLGMADTRMTHDEAGNTRLFAGLRSTCRDLARFGYLFLRGGAWDGRQVVPRPWVAAATGRPSQPLNAGYGLLWWLNRPGARPEGAGAALGATAPDDDGPGTDDDQMVPGAPEDMFWAVGLGGQIVQVDPGSETVVVRLGSEDAELSGPFYQPADAAAVVTEALAER